MTDNGAVVPLLGLGTWRNVGEACAESVEAALEAGYRHVDTARYYDNEAAVGAGVARADVPREEVFVASKLWHDDLAAEDVPARARESLDRLGLEYVDLLYVHWPTDTYDPEGTLGAFADLRDDGLVRHVGVSNFRPEDVDAALDALDAPLFANQVEMHPLLPRDDLLAHCRERDVNVVAYSPLARGKVFDVPEIVEVAEKHDVSPAQVSLAWLLQRDGVATIPKATGEEHIRDNFGALDLELDDEDLAKIDGIDERSRQVDPGFAPWN